ncbi:putative mycofactocin biosynthesis transcriptional regulator MftR [Frankia canadensis]|uniref:Putative mycofactocin biosynthesis transcriptional regulator MftR n=1 Tax=Frankia canadensis TaxID=1836972 RepID=A0A2I2KJV4_9ACTN|nr:mycofactocin system transcriptional regulator [Frankia canadensis]SNQ45940.1 putative mycofactocin biosynthesis transcriptional regulator MftR [Frankia canadensis]SOU53230.1 putative mycofactocin biosynthesis transcriptional regulator MftR [Frankia canadensis]
MVTTARIVDGRRSGRRPATSASELEHLALRMFTERGFEETTVDDIAREAGIGRRTVFRYFASKNDLAWGNFDAHLEVMRSALAAASADEPMLTALRRAILDFNTYPSAEGAWLRRRMTLILRTPALQAHSTLRFASWRAVVAEFVAHRTAQPTAALLPQAVAAAHLGVAVSAYEQWLKADGADLVAILDEAIRMLHVGFAVADRHGGRRLAADQASN